MPTIRLVPSTYALSNSTYLSIANANNMLTNTDSETYATITNSRTSTTDYYLYLRGFNFSDIPSNAVVESYTVKIKANQSGVSDAVNYHPFMAKGTATIASAYSDPITSDVKVLPFAQGSSSWERIRTYDSTFGIRINCRRAASGTTGYMYIYGAEIEVVYTIPIPATVTSTLNGNGTISPNGTTSTSIGNNYRLKITPTTKSDAVTITKNGVDVSNQLVPGGMGGTETAVLGAYKLISGSFGGSAEEYFSGLPGKGVDANQLASSYKSGNSSTQAVFSYALDFPDVPDSASITRVYCEVNGHAENTARNTEYMCVQLKSGSTNLSSQYNFKSAGTTNTTYTLQCTTTPTVEQLKNMVLECTLGYYGGIINGATCYVEYEVNSRHPDFYTYTYEVDGDAAIIVTLVSTGVSVAIHYRRNGTWGQASKIYRKQNGSWVEVEDLSEAFDRSINYISG